MLNGQNLLSARNLILASAVVLVLSVLGMCITMLRPLDSGGLARDSYGTRNRGHRALVETLEELGINVSRSFSPPQPNANDRYTLVMLDPNARLVAISPKYAQALRKWIDGGGRVVVTPSTPQRHNAAASQPSSEDEQPVDILDALGIDQQIAVRTTSDGLAESEDSADGVDRDNASNDFDWDTWNRPQRTPPRSVEVLPSGTLARLKSHVREIMVPGDEIRTLTAKPEDLAGSLTYTNDNEDRDPHLLVAILRRGAGEIVVVADPAIVSNELIARSDNSILAVNLLAPEGNGVVFDEFYHGLAVRGNPFYLLTRPGFAAATIGLLTVVGTLAWRAAVYLGPPLADAQVKRRDIGEYVSAMAGFFSHGSGSRRFIVQEVRDGVLRQICLEMRLPIDTLDVDTITAALARHDRLRAERLAAAVCEVDAGLAAAGEYSHSRFLPVMQRLASCL